MATANPAMNLSVYNVAGRSEAATMTVASTAIKTGILLVLVVVAGGYTFSLAMGEGAKIPYGLLIAGSLGGFITALVTIFFPKISPFTAPLYAVLEGLFLGAISALAELRSHGIAIQAVGLSIGVLAVMLFVYATGIIRATQKVRIGIVAATGAVCLVYLVGFVMSLFGAGIPYIHDSGPIGIGFSIVVVVIAALNLILDFDFIEQGVQRQAPKYMEWYGGFSLLVTLVWMYLEILRLLAKLKDNR